MIGHFYSSRIERNNRSILRIYALTFLHCQTVRQLFPPKDNLELYKRHFHELEVHVPFPEIIFPKDITNTLDFKYFLYSIRDFDDKIWLSYLFDQISTEEDENTIIPPIKFKVNYDSETINQDQNSIEESNTNVCHFNMTRSEILQSIENRFQELKAKSHNLQYNFWLFKDIDISPYQNDDWIRFTY